MITLRLFPLLLGVLVLVTFAAMLAIGSVYPEAHVIVREIELDSSPVEVWKLVSDREQYPEWVPGLDSVRRVEDDLGREAWLHSGRGGEIRVSVESLERERRLISRVSGSESAFVSSWTCEVAPRGGGSRLTVTERGRIPGRIGRFWTHFVFGPDHAIDAWLTAVSLALGDDAVPGPGHAGTGGEA